MTTDTALFTSKEILEEKKNINDLEFIEEPEVPTDSSVIPYLEFRFPISSIVAELKIGENEKNLDLSDLRKKLI